MSKRVAEVKTEKELTKAEQQRLLVDKQPDLRRARGWCFTINNYTVDDMWNVDSLLDLPNTYLVVGFEIGEDCGTPHMQGYVYLKDKVSRKWLSTRLPRAWLNQARAKGDKAYRAAEYCKEDGDFWEYGSFPTQGKMLIDNVLDAYEQPREDFRVFSQYRHAVNDLLSREKADEHKEDVKRIRLIKQDDIYDVHELANCKQSQVFILNYGEGAIGFKKYDLNDWQLSYKVLVLPINCFSNVFPLKGWSKGYYPTARFGFELRPINPDIVYLTYGKDDYPKVYDFLNEWRFHPFVDFEYTYSDSTCKWEAQVRRDDPKVIEESTANIVKINEIKNPFDDIPDNTIEDDSPMSIQSFEDSE